MSFPSNKRLKDVSYLLNAVTTNQTSEVFSIAAGRRTFQSKITGTGAVAATVTWYGNNVNAIAGGVLLVTDTLSGTTSDQTGSDIPAEWPYVYCILSAISGASASVTTTVSV